MRRAHVPLHRSEEHHRRSVEHEASTSKIGEDQIFYCNQRGISTQDAVNMIVNGFCKEVFQRIADGIRGRSAEIAGRQLGGERWIAMKDKELAIETISQLPEDSSMAEIAEEIQIMAALKKGKEDVKAGRVMPQQDVRKLFEAWISK